MRGQTALVRESCKWDCELKFPDQIAGLLDRGAAIANSTPKGPVYLSLRREVLCEPTDEATLVIPPQMAPVTGAPNPEDIHRAAAMLAGAKRPLIIAQRGAGDAKSFHAFADLAYDWGLPVCSWWTTKLAISTEHRCHIGPDPGPFLAQADVVLVVNARAPWWPDKHPLGPDTKVINLGPDPIFSRTPVRNFRSDITLAGETHLALMALIDAMQGLDRDRVAINARHEHLKGASDGWRVITRTEAAQDNARGITKDWVSKCLGEALRRTTSSVFSELGTILGTLERTEYQSWFQEPHSGGLGWSFPTALGAKLADPNRVCVASAAIIRRGPSFRVM
jgi:acetolactate synthase-1/2/3 large subunit